MPDIAQYDAVRIVALPAVQITAGASVDVREPRVGDIAYVIDIYSNPPGYELECSDSEGITLWLRAFPPDDIVLEKIP